MLEIAAVCLVITALLAYLNHRFLGLPGAIGMMAASLALSLALVGLDAAGITGTAHVLRQYAETLVRSVDFSNVLMQGMLSMLLFAGALHVDLKQLKIYRWPVAALAVLGTTLSTVAVGYGMWVAMPLVDLQLPLIYCLLFGALISPTDPIAVISILKSAHAPQELELVIAGESLFNDGVAVVIFSLLLGMLASGTPPTVDQALQLLAHEAGGGVLFGLALGYVLFRMLRSVDSYEVGPDPPDEIEDAVLALAASAVSVPMSRSRSTCFSASARSDSSSSSLTHSRQPFRALLAPAEIPEHVGARVHIPDDDPGVQPPGKRVGELHAGGRVLGKARGEDLRYTIFRL